MSFFGRWNKKKIEENNKELVDSKPLATNTTDTIEELVMEDDNLIEPFEIRLNYSEIFKGASDETIRNVKVRNWLKRDGDWIDRNKPICVIDYNSFGSYFLRTKKSGFLEIAIPESYFVNDGAVLYTLNPVNSSVIENILFKPSFSYYFDQFACSEFSQEYLQKDFRIIMWKKQDGEFVNKDEVILAISEKYYSGKISNTYYHKAEKSGFLDIVHCDIYPLNQNNILYTINEDDEKRINRKFINIPDIVFDDFTNKKTIKWKQIGHPLYYSQGIVSKSNDNHISFIFTFNNLDDKDFIVFQFASKELNLSKGDIVSFLFEDNRIIDFIIKESSYRLISNYEEKHLENKIQITEDELRLFEDYDLLKWKIVLKKQNVEIFGGEEGTGKYQSSKDLKIVIRKLTKEYRSLVSAEIENYQPLLERDTLTSLEDTPLVEECHVYLMIDTVNNYHKIGISNKPSWREKTLQSEKPSIELLASKKFINRKIAYSFEKALHDAYDEKRIRGEWFNLDESEIKEITHTLND